MRRIILTIFATSALITLAGCGKVHDPSSVTEATVVEVEPTEEVIVTATDNVDASIIKTEVTEAGYIYTVFVSSNEAYSVLKNDCVKFLDETYKNISDVHQDVKVFVWNLNDVSTTNTCAFIRIESPTILDMKKVFISVFGTTKYQEGMVFDSVEEYRDTYGMDTLVSMYIQASDSPFNTTLLYEAERHIFNSLRLINLGDGYDVIHVSTQNTKSYVEDNTLWTPVDATYLTGTDYSEEFHDILNNSYIACADINGTYEDITVIRDTNNQVTMRVKNGIPEVGITNYTAGADAPNCVLGNIILADGVTTIEPEAARRAIIIFFN